MAGSLTNTAEAELLNHVLGGEPLSSRPILYLGYMVGTPTESGPGSEPGLNSGYDRVPVANNITNFPVCTNQIKILATDVVFPEALSNHGLVQAVGIFDSPAVGQGRMLAYSPLPAPVDITVGDSYRIPASSITIKFNAGGLSNYAKNGLLNKMFGDATFNLPTTLYFSYCTTTPTDAAPGTEPSTGGYARVGLPNTVQLFPHASEGIKTNAVEVAFPEATASQGSMAAVQIHDQLSGGNYLGRWELPNPFAIALGTQPVAAPSTLNVTLD